MTRPSRGRMTDSNSYRTATRIFRSTSERRSGRLRTHSEGRRYGSTEAEFGVTDEAWAELPIDAETARVINDGLRIFYDPDGLLAAAVATALA